MRIRCSSAMRMELIPRMPVGAAVMICHLNNSKIINFKFKSSS
uniref:Uncharacterized protein n=1 Tax=Phlebotomus papatasi TaxID=29031 RepID=A0A1B0DJL4_PHLPP